MRRQALFNGLTAVLIVTIAQETYLLIREHNKFAGVHFPSLLRCGTLGDEFVYPTPDE